MTTVICHYSRIAAADSRKAILLAIQAYRQCVIYSKYTTGYSENIHCKAGVQNAGLIMFSATSLVDIVSTGPAGRAAARKGAKPWAACALKRPSAL